MLSNVKEETGGHFFHVQDHMNRVLLCLCVNLHDIMNFNAIKVKS
jgi:hypothetical protein